VLTIKIPIFVFGAAWTITALWQCPFKRNKQHTENKMKASLEGWHNHKNGGGLVQDTAFVEESVHIGKNARVSGNAQVSGNARVSGNAQVSGCAHVSGNSQVYCDAQVYGDALVYGDAKVYGDKWETSPLYIQGTKHELTNGKYGYIRIGCRSGTFNY